jgi:Tfp pilus assembly protein PilF
LALLLIGWAYDFPPAIGIFTGLTIVFFLVRLFLLWTAAHELEHARYRIADRLVRAALRIYPWSADALAVRARWLSSQGDDVGAEQVLRRAAHFAPGSADIHGALAGTLLQRGEFAAAREEAVHARQLAPSPVATQHLAWLALHVDHDPAKAQRLLQSAEPNKLQAPLAAPLMVLLTEVQVARNTLNAAQATMHRIETMLDACPLPQQAELAYHLGRLHNAAGDDGSPYFRRSLDLDPHGRYAHSSWREMVQQRAGGSEQKTRTKN